MIFLYVSPEKGRLLGVKAGLRGSKQGLNI